ncbi:isoprenylcysteine carboxylmethyltransferase family protein [Hyphomicrobium sp.]|jgi:protein-S-isoprenylcysteine O-methyltransferase Ste14|uniref:methyltransferase family protein n=1 Tax=Hyphomicrobium sp. TaxID=82 RepID=UPI003566AEE0
MTIDRLLTIAGIASAFLLIAGMIAGRMKPAWRIWPAPPVGSLKSFLFWSLFRTLNIAVLILAAERFLTTLTGQMVPFRIALAAVSFASGIGYAYTLWSLGRKATYCQVSGLATGGVYRWTRNPQYATAILAFATLGLAAWAWDATLLAATLVIVYAMMAITEEPWLEARYGRAYIDYKVEVPRFFNVRHAINELHALLSSKVPSLANGQRGKR